MHITVPLALAVLGLTTQSPAPPAHAAPLTVTIVELRLARNDRTIARIRIPEGTPALVTLQGEQPLALTPTARDTWVELVVEALGADREIAGGRTELGRYQLDSGVPVEIAALAVPVRIEWVHSVTVSSLGPSRLDGPCTRCCVVCGGDLFCACAVETVCGSCCCPTACNCLQDTGPRSGETRSGVVESTKNTERAIHRNPPRLPPAARVGVR